NDFKEYPITNMATETSNETEHFMNAELECLLQIHQEREMEIILDSPPFEGCSRVWDSLLCWPPTLPGIAAIMPCFPELNGIRYDTS
ncbi:hypothetical protein LSTR_LSTR013268, partial [Laodelphax striatellus]